MTLTLPRLIGHRGAAAGAPENTLAGFRHAKASGAGWVEFDVRVAADGEVVLMHDATLDRTTDGAGLLAAHNTESLRRLDAGSWFDRAFAGEPVPTLAAALNLCAELGLGIDLEIKRDRQGPGREARNAVTAIAWTLAAAWPRQGPPLVVSSFDAGLVEVCAAALPAVPRMLAAGRLTDATIATAKRLGCVAIAGSARHLRADMAGRVHGAGLALAVYTVNDPVQARKLYGWGVDCLISDRPDHLASAAAGS
jgi:glycerophosphoryl diester phosphodiesterase